MVSFYDIVKIQRAETKKSDEAIGWKSFEDCCLGLLGMEERLESVRHWFMSQK